MNEEQPASLLTQSKKKIKNIGIFLKDDDEEEEEEKENKTEILGESRLDSFVNMQTLKSTFKNSVQILLSSCYIDLNYINYTVIKISIIEKRLSRHLKFC